MFKGVSFKVVVCFLIFVFVAFTITFFVIDRFPKKKSVDNDFKEGPVVSDYVGSTSSGIPLPRKEDVVRTFCNLIDEGRISDAVDMTTVEGEVKKQSWGENFNNFSLFKLVNIRESEIDENSFEVDIDVKLKENLINLPIPNYGWENGVNKRWINLIEKDGLYKISEVATGP